MSNLYGSNSRSQIITDGDFDYRIRGANGQLRFFARPTGSLYGACSADSPVTTTPRQIGMPAGSSQDQVFFPISASQIQVASTNINDTSAGTGCRTCYIGGLDANWDEINETITLNGQTPVLTTKSFIRINIMYSITVGSSGTNLGDIYATDNTDTFTAGVPDNRVIHAWLFGTASLPSNYSSMFKYSVPRNRRWWLQQGNYYLQAKNGIIFDEYYIDNFGAERIAYKDGPLGFSASGAFNFRGAGPYSPMTDYYSLAKSGTGTAELAVYYQAALEDTKISSRL